MHSSRPDCVLGDARLISSTMTTLAKIGPGRNSKRSSRWLKTLTPTTSAGSRSAVHCTRANCRSKARATERASVVLPTPGQILDEDVPLGRHAHQHQVQEVAAHLDRVRDRQRHLAPQLLRAGDLLLADRAWFLPDALHAHCERSLMP